MTNQQFWKNTYPINGLLLKIISYSYPDVATRYNLLEERHMAPPKIRNAVSFTEGKQVEDRLEIFLDIYNFNFFLVMPSAENCKEITLAFQA